MKMSIEWHENCLKDMDFSLKEKKKDLKALMEEIKRLETRILVRKEQIVVAKNKNKDCFDEEKFLKIRKEKN